MQMKKLNLQKSICQSYSCLINGKIKRYFISHPELTISTTANIYAHLEKSSKQHSADIITGILQPNNS